MGLSDNSIRICKSNHILLLKVNSELLQILPVRFVITSGFEE